MSDIPAPSTRARKFRVQVGLAECTVTCEDRKEAVQAARDHLCREMPHMVSAINGIRDKEFRVDQVG